MNSINNQIAISGLAADIRARLLSESHSGKQPVKDNADNSVADNTLSDPMQKTASFSTYGSHNERIRIVVKNKETGEIVREIPSKEMQKLHDHLDMLV